MGEIGRTDPLKRRDAVPPVDPVAPSDTQQESAKREPQGFIFGPGWHRPFSKEVLKNVLGKGKIIDVTTGPIELTTGKKLDEKA